MHRKMWIVPAFCLLAVGCMKPEPEMMGPPKKPSQPPEMKVFAPLIGTWTGTAEMIEPSAEEMKKHMPPGSPEPQMTYAGGGTYKWDINDLYVHAEGWHDMGEGEKAHYHELIGWNPVKKMYHSWYVSDYGERGDGWMTASADGMKFTVKTSGLGMGGKPAKGEGTMTIVDDNTVEWTWTENGAMGRMKMKGTMKKQS